MLLRVVGVVVDAEHDRDVGIGGGRGDHDLLGPCVEMLLSTFAVGEQAGRLDHEVDLQIAPRQRRRVAFGEDFQLRLACPDDAVTDFDVLTELSEHGVVLQEVPHGLGIPEIVDRHDLEIPPTLELSPKEVAPNASKPVDPHPCLGHKPESKGAAADAGCAGVGRKRSPLGDESSEIIMACEARRISDDEAGRRGSSEDDLPLRLNHAQDLGVGRGLNPAPDERGPATR